MSAPDITDRITNYLATGGLFNPELAEHDRVRNLLMDCRTDIAAKDAEIARLKQEQFEFCEQCNSPLSQCGPQGPDGIPTMDCLACKLRKRIAELEKELAEFRTDMSGVIKQALDRLMTEKDRLITEREQRISYLEETLSMALAEKDGAVMAADKRDQRIAELAALLDRVPHEGYCDLPAAELIKANQTIEAAAIKMCPACAWAKLKEAK